VSYRQRPYQARKTQLIRDIVKVTHESIGPIRRSSMFFCLRHPADNMSISVEFTAGGPKQVVEQAQA